MIPAPARIAPVRRRLLRWHRSHRRDLPWRRTRDPYRILVSEVMLQQTRVDQVIPFYRSFLRRFPTPVALARATSAEVLRAWYGLGYNRRAVNLHRAVQTFAGRPFPRPVGELEALPGIGRYTASAVATFAWNAPEPLLETNSSRVLHRVFLGPELPAPRATSHQLFALAAATLDRRDPRRWNEALFDLGATVCTKRSPRCDRCPLRSVCRSKDRIPTSVPHHPSQRREPLFRGEPRRLWRGRVLRTLHAGSRSVSDVGKALGLGGGYRAAVGGILESLVRDGLAVRTGRRYRLPGRV